MGRDRLGQRGRICPRYASEECVTLFNMSMILYRT